MLLWMGSESNMESNLGDIKGEQGQEIVPAEVVAEGLDEDVQPVNEDVMQRRQVEITSDMKGAEIMERYNVSRATAWRALKRAEKDPEGRSYIFLNYYVKEINIDEHWAKLHHEELSEDADFGARLAITRMKKVPGSVDAFLSPLSFDDLKQDAFIRLWQLSGRVEDRDDPKWRRGVALRAAADFIRTNVVRHQSRRSKTNPETIRESFEEE